jgi:predicted dehydrogenase
VERFNPAWKLAVEQVGRPTVIESARLAPFTFRSMDVGVVHDLMIHDIDLVLSLEPGRLEHLEAHGLAATGGHEDAVKARLTFASGLVADLTASRISPVLRRTVSIWSTTARSEAEAAGPDRATAPGRTRCGAHRGLRGCRADHGKRALGRRRRRRLRCRSPGLKSAA